MLATTPNTTQSSDQLQTARELYTVNRAADWHRTVNPFYQPRGITQPTRPTTSTGLNPALLPQPSVLPGESSGGGGIGSTLKRVGVGATVIGAGVLGVWGASKAIGAGIGAIKGLLGVKAASTAATATSTTTTATTGFMSKGLAALGKGFSAVGSAIGAAAVKVGSVVSFGALSGGAAAVAGATVFGAAAVGVALWLRRRADNKNKEADTKVINDFNEHVLEPIRKELFEGPQPATMAEREKKLKLYLNLIEVGFHGGTDPVSGQQISGVAAAFKRKQSVDSQAGYQSQIRQEIEKAYRAQFMPPSMQELKYTGPGKSAVG